MGVAAAGIAAAAIGAGASIYAADQSSKTAKKGSKSQAALSAAERLDRNVISDKVGAEQQLATEQLQSAEKARSLVRSQLGAPGTYGPTTAGSGAFQINLPQGLGGLSSSTPGGLYGKKTVSGVAEGGQFNRKTGKTSGAWEVEGEVADPYATAADITSQPQFQAISGMVAEANQLMNREGPMWDTLVNSTVGAVYEGAATLQRQQMEEIARSVARGGSARRVGFAMAQRFQAQERINAQRSSQLWQARMGLEEFRTKAAAANISVANAWVDNQAGIRDTFTEALTNLRTFWSKTMPGLAVPAGSASSAADSSFLRYSTEAQLQATAAKNQAIVGAVEAATGAIGTAWAARSNSSNTGSGINASGTGALNA